MSACTWSLTATGDEQLLPAAAVSTGACPDGDSILLAAAVDIDPTDEDATEAGVMDRRGGGGRGPADPEPFFA